MTREEEGDREKRSRKERGGPGEGRRGEGGWEGEEVKRILVQQQHSIAMDSSEQPWIFY